MSDNFFSRWSRRKQGLDTTETVPPVAKAPSAAAPGAAAPQVAALAKAPNVAAVDGPAQEQQALPTLEDVQHLTPSSDFQTFMRQGVPGEVRNAAMKKLFTDPHFNVMDGLDIYIGDYNTPDPLPAGMLEKMVGAEFLNLFPPKAPDVPPALGHSQVPPTPEQGLAAPQAAPLVAQSPSSHMTPTLQATPALQASEPTDHDHPDLQLQPNHAPACPEPGQGTG
jgi:hypothetical protein